MEKNFTKSGLELQEIVDVNSYESEKLNYLLEDFIYKRNLWRSATFKNGKPTSLHIFCSQIDAQIKDYIVNHFTLNELIIAFVEYDTINCPESIIRKLRRSTIKAINDTNSLSLDDKAKLKRKVWEMNLILYKLVNDFVVEFLSFYKERISFSKN